MSEANTIKSEYAALESKRKAVLDRARECSKLTLPYIMPPEGHTEDAELYKPYQSMGADGVKHLSSKLLLTLFPPGSPFYRLTYDVSSMEAAEQQTGRALKTEIEAKLSAQERVILDSLESKGIRPPMFIVMKHLLITGNALIFNPPGKEPKIYFLSNFVVKRDPRGNVVLMIVKETVDIRVLPEDIRAAVINKEKDQEKKSKFVDLFTKIQLDKTGKNYDVTQEVCDVPIPATKYSYPVDRHDWIPLRWTRIDGEDYGRSYVEEYLGDLISLETLSQAIVEGSAAASRILFLVAPNGTTRIKALRDTPNCGFAEGNANDVTVLQVQKFADFATAEKMIARLEQRLFKAFLMASSIQRNAERVTAEEIRFMAGELEDALGGVYSILTVDLQLKLVVGEMSYLSRIGKLPKLPTVKPQIITGLDALSRGHEMQRLDVFLAGVERARVVVPGIEAELSAREIIQRLGVGSGINMTGILKSEEQVAEESQRAELSQGIETLGPPAINALAKASQQQQQ